MNRMNGIKKKKQYILILPLPFYFYLYYTNNTTNHHNYYFLYLFYYIYYLSSHYYYIVSSLSLSSLSRRMRFFRLLNILGIGWGGGVLNGGTDSDAHGTEKPRKTRRATGQIIRRA